MAAGDVAEVFRGDDGQFYFRVKAANHEVIAESEGYHNKGDAINVLEQHFGEATILDLAD